MTASRYSQPDDFSTAPLLTLLPRHGSLEKLETLTSPLYARYENVENRLRELDPNAEPEVRKRLKAEESMLKLVLDWLATKPMTTSEKS